MIQESPITIERVIEETISDPVSFYHGEAIRWLLKYEAGNTQALDVAMNRIQKLILYEQRQAVAKAPPVLVSSK